MINESFVYQIDRYKKMLVSIKKKEEVQAPSFLIYKVLMKRILFLKKLSIVHYIQFQEDF